ncbi:MAG: phosphatidylglycerophosphatase A [Planctomycetes bacterium]|nr:phosphatidylglycerophosphatase A [Planctomycetota bacterium]
MDCVRWFLITSGGLGLSPVVPGTVGTFGGVALALLLMWLFGSYSVIAWGAAALLLFVWSCGQSEYVARTWPKKDPGAFVLDEVVGFLVTLVTFQLLVMFAPLEFVDENAVSDGLNLLIVFCGAFGWFRVFDILKIYPCNRLEQLPGALGIMADDQVAGVYAGVALWLSMPVAMSVLG